MRLKDLAAARVRYGYQRLHILLRREGWPVNHKRTYRIYKEEGLSIRPRLPKRKRAWRYRQGRPEIGGPNEVCDPPPLKWSALRYAFWQKEDGSDAEEETQARRDRSEAAAGSCSDVARSERCRCDPLDRGHRGDLLPLAPGVRRAEERAGEAAEGLETENAGFGGP